MQTIILYLTTNFAVLIMISTITKIFGFEPYLNQNGLNLTSLLIFSGLVGFAGSFISLFASKWMAKKSMGLQMITTPANELEKWVYSTVERQARQAGIGMPEVAVYNSPQPNAFATGANKNNALVAVSTGLIKMMNKEEVEAVLGHEVSHVANGDMVRLSLIQGVVNTFVFFFSRIAGHLIDRAVFKNESGRGPGYWITTIVAEIVLGVLATMIVMWFSRKREFKADEGGARLGSKQGMIGALERLGGLKDPEELPEQLAAFGISGKFSNGLAKLFTSHPPIPERVAALKQR